MEAPNRQPDDGPGVHQDCVILWGPDHYRWHDDPCSLEQYFICEDTTHLKQTPNLPGKFNFTYFSITNRDICCFFLQTVNLNHGFNAVQIKYQHLRNIRACWI